MKQRDKFINKDHFQLNFQVGSGCFQQAIQKNQSKDLSKKASLSKLEESACGSKEPQAVFFDNLISVKTVAERLGLAPKTIYNWVYLRKIPYVKFGNKVMFRPKSLKAWLNRKEIKSWQ